jgi:hypothetical protein
MQLLVESAILPVEIAIVISTGRIADVKLQGKQTNNMNKNGGQDRNRKTTRDDNRQSKQACNRFSDRQTDRQIEGRTKKTTTDRQAGR